MTVHLNIVSFGYFMIISYSVVFAAPFARGSNSFFGLFVRITEQDPTTFYYSIEQIIQMSTIYKQMFIFISAFCTYLRYEIPCRVWRDMDSRRHMIT